MVSDHDDAAYLYLPAAGKKPGWKAARSVDVSSFIEGYSGPDVRLDFDDEGQLMGIEIIE